MLQFIMIHSVWKYHREELFIITFFFFFVFRRNRTKHNRKITINLAIFIEYIILVFFPPSDQSHVFYARARSKRHYVSITRNAGFLLNGFCVTKHVMTSLSFTIRDFCILRVYRGQTQKQFRVDMLSYVCK